MKQRLSHALDLARSAKDRGAVMFLAAVMILIVMTAGAIAVDLSLTSNRGQELQNAVDSAALAGVQAYRQSMGADTIADSADEAAAAAAITALLAQNGIEGLTPVIEFPDGENYTEVRVTLLDDDPGLLLSGFTGSGGSVERSATARFERCEDGCIKEIQIPEPFRSVDTTGDGDGYKPIPVGDQLYALNHNATTLQIVCVDRTTQDHCWDTGAGKNAYPSGYQPPRNPEMPNAAVVDTRIFWSATLSSGVYVYCFETVTATPCSSPFRLNNSARVTANESRTENRGGGTFTTGNNDDQRVFVFTDDHRVHCILPVESPTGFYMTWCSGYENNGLPTGLADLDFPANDPALGNHGSSIDRIFDDSGRVYSTLHIDYVEPEIDCNNDGANIEDPQSGTVVVLKNASSGLFIAADETNNYDTVRDGTDPSLAEAQWTILSGSWWNPNIGSYERVYAFKSLAADEAGYNRYINIGDWPSYGEELVLSESLNASSGGNNQSVFTIDYQTSTSRIVSWNTYWNNGPWEQAYVREGAINVGQPNEDLVFLAGDYESSVADWVIRPWQCEDPSYGGNTYNGATHMAGTWLHCFNINTGTACSGFAPSRIHEDWDSFSGRLFFYYGVGPDPAILGVCSTGFNEHWEWKNMSSATELKCVDDQTGIRTTSSINQEQTMGTFVSALAAQNTGGPGWGTWGDPHYNEHTNRIFYPTHRVQSRVLCWDFDTGWCGQVQGYSALNGYIQDYGFFSEGNCIYGLGHNAVFWAFEAENINEECKGSSKTAPITPCNCGGNLYWGSLTFDVDVELFDSFYIEIHDDDGNRIYPPVDPTDLEDPGHSLHTDGDVIDLNFHPITDADQQLWVTVTVEAEGDPWADGDQSLTVELERTPRLTD